jgi:hypothetical protein
METEETKRQAGSVCVYVCMCGRPHTVAAHPQHQTNKLN